MTRAEMEQRRFEAERLFEQGLRKVDIARHLNVTYKTVKEWSKRIHNGGMAATKATGRPRIVPMAMIRFLYETPGMKWTARQFRNAIQINCKVEYQLEHCRRLLKKLRRAAVESTERAG